MVGTGVIHLSSAITLTAELNDRGAGERGGWWRAKTTINTYQVYPRMYHCTLCTHHFDKYDGDIYPLLFESAGDIAPSLCLVAPPMRWRGRGVPRALLVKHFYIILYFVLVYRFSGTLAPCPMARGILLACLWLWGEKWNIYSEMKRQSPRFYFCFEPENVTDS